MNRSSPQPARWVGRAARAIARLVVVVALLLANRTTTCAAPGDALVAVQAAIDAANSAYVAALVKKDATAFGALFTVDAVSLPARSPAVHGRDAIVESMRGVFRHVTFERGRLRTLETHLHGDVADEIGSYEFDILVDGNAEKLQGRYLAVWRVVDGVWKIAIDSSQPDAPTG